MKSIRLAFCLAALGVLLVIIGLAKGMSAGSSSGPLGCANQGPGSAAGHVPAGDPCVRGRAGWDQVGYAFIAPGVFALIGAARIRLTVRR
ncbi:MAG TPA: hypothetical protein VFU36_17740 [Jatrophihabitans sp.]|nr:hypothetical protein [Jatrophihabitans sp.]